MTCKFSVYILYFPYSGFLLSQSKPKFTLDRKFWLLSHNNNQRANWVVQKIIERRQFHFFSFLQKYWPFSFPIFVAVLTHLTHVCPNSRVHPSINCHIGRYAMIFTKRQRLDWIARYFANRIRHKLKGQRLKIHFSFFKAASECWNDLFENFSIYSWEY